MNTGRQVIAYVPKGYVWAAFICAPVMCLILLYALYDLVTDWRNFGYWNTYLIVLVLAAVPFSFRYFRLLLSGERNMVWLEDGQVVFVHPDQFSVRCKDVADIKLASDDRGYPEASFTLNNRTQTSFRLQGLDQEPEVIVARLRTACGLPDEPNAATPRQA